MNRQERKGDKEIHIYFIYSGLGKKENITSMPER